MRNMRDMLAGLGKAMTPADKGRTMATKLGMSPNDNFVLKSGSLPDNEPRFETRSPENQMFSIENEISNLMKSYNMLVDAQEFDRAQQVANQIDQLQQQKIGIQAQNVPLQQPELSVPERDKISEILDSISI